MSVAFVGNAVGAAISTPLVLELVKHQGWRLPFVEFGAVGVVWALVWYWWFRDRPEEHKAVNAEELRFIRSDEVDADQLGHTRHVPWGVLLRSANLAFICGMYFAFGYALYFYITWLPTYLLTARHFSPTYAGFFSALPWLASAGGFWLGGELSHWPRSRCCRYARYRFGACYELRISAASIFSELNKPIPSENVVATQTRVRVPA